MLRADLLGDGSEEQLFQNIFQFPDIAGPFVSREALQVLVGELRDRAAYPATEPAPVMIHQVGNVSSSVAQRWQINAYHVQAVEEVLAETAAAHHCLEIL